MSGQQHMPVLLPEALEAMKIKANGTYIDCTFGRGGHSQAFLSQLSTQGQLLVLDQDISAIKIAEEKFSTDKRVTIIHESFANLSMLGESKNLNEKVDGIFFDLGVSSP
ncbi:MAG: 16S rRNA (cytosine(1402)-N(4))-methyltransferase, partial [Pseudomonadota bacterium]